VGGATTAELCRARDQVQDADLVELRLDSVGDPDAARALAGRQLPVIVTCRPRWEGGQFDGSEEERLRLLRRAWELGAEYVDVEHAASFSDLFLASTQGRHVVLSLHDFSGVPRDLGGRVTAMRQTPAEVIKIAVQTTRLSDALEVFALQRLLRTREFVAIGMGLPGIATRVLASRAGSCWTYAGEGWAPGQIPAADLREKFRFHAIGKRTALYGVLGRPIAHSLSPAMHNAAFAAESIDAVYLPLEAADVEDFLTFGRVADLRGVSVTAPFKVTLARHVWLDEEARRAGALNTLIRHGNTWRATNTDVEGFLAPLRRRGPLAAVRASVLGGGGAARAAARGLSREGAIVTIHTRRREQAEHIAESLRVRVGAWPPDARTWDLLVNATPVGTAPHVEETPWPDARFDGSLVYDLVYNPRETRLLREAAAAGCDTLGGLEMLVAQAQQQFHLWTGRVPDAALMQAAAERELHDRSVRVERPRSAQPAAPPARSRPERLSR
jgi:3-dehydroquinate dehydratase / shikimate dehydrogenase